MAMAMHRDSMRDYGWIAMMLRESNQFRAAVACWKGADLWKKDSGDCSKPLAIPSWISTDARIALADRSTSRPNTSPTCGTRAVASFRRKPCQPKHGVMCRMGSTGPMCERKGAVVRFKQEER